MERIIELASNPLSSEIREFRKEAEKPVQFLACCLEISKIEKILSNGHIVDYYDSQLQVSAVLL